jgi:dienelactone hydrolase
MIRILLISIVLPAILHATGSASVASQRRDAIALDSAQHEEVIFITVRMPDDSANLETTVYRPKGGGSHPLVVINHGANGRLPSFHDQERFRPEELAEFFTARGYLVAVPMREGFAHSTGNCTFHCNHAQYALTYARDIKAVIAYFVLQGAANPQQILVIGQSNGAVVTLGYAASAPVAKAIINISGGIDTYGPDCNWRSGMMSAATILGAKTTIPSLWMYAKDDPIFPPSVSRPFFEAYNTAGGKAQMTLFSEGGHGFALRLGSQRVWGKTVTQFLESVALPFEVVK